MAKITATVTRLNTVINDVNNAVMHFDAIHGLAGVGYWVQAMVRASPLIDFTYSPLHYLRESHGSLGS